MKGRLFRVAVVTSLSALTAGWTWAQQDQLPRWSAQEIRLLKSLSPLPGLAPDPTNRWADDLEAARFGRRLFFDPRLSANGQISCASCHDPALGWSDGKALAEGIHQVGRNSPTVLLAAYQRWQFWDGRADSLWAQARWPLEHPDEMGFSRGSLIRLLSTDAELQSAYTKVFGPLPDGADDAQRFPATARPPLPRAQDPFQPAPSLSELSAEDPGIAAWFKMKEEDRRAATEVLVHVTKALAAYERRLVSGPSVFDHFVAALPNPERVGADGHLAVNAAMSASAQNGLRFFIGDGGCLNCHFSPLLSGGEFHNLGLSLAAGATADTGRVDGIRTLNADPLNGRGVHSDARDWDSNRKLRFLKYDQHTYGAYKAPSLRNVALTAPYMHDGRFATLEDVLRFYSELPGQPPSGHREETLVPLDLAPQQIQDLGAFLRTLTGTPVPPEWNRPAEASPAATDSQ